MYYFKTTRMDRHHMRSARFASQRATNNMIETRRRMSREIGGVEDHIARLTLVCEAMWTLIQDHTELSDEDLFARIGELDDADGQSDLKMTRVAQTCECGAKVPVKMATCQFCGADAPYSTPFDLL